MRWLVEVTSLGKAGSESVTVEAESWHTALEGVRRTRGEASPLNGFSIELLENGCRALDPKSRLRYTVTVAQATATPALAPAPVDSPPEAPPPAAPEPRPFQIAFRREQERTDAMPLTYREYVLAVPPGTTEGSAGELLRLYLGTVREALADRPAGKLVNLAVFEAPFEGRPVTRPLATLTWKDWNAEPSVAFPRSVPTPDPVVPAALVATPVIVRSASAVVDERFVPVASARGAEAAEDQGAGSPIEPAQATANPPASTIVEAGPKLVAAPSGASHRPRLRADELLGELFESMHGLHFIHDPISGADLCLTIATEAMPAKWGLVHLYDIGHRQFVVASVSGTAIERLRTRRHPESDAMLARAMRSREALVISNFGDDDSPVAPRYVEMGGVRSLVMARAALHGRFLGAIELIDPLDGLPFTETEGNALTYIAEQFAEFIASRGIGVDPGSQGAPRVR